jgi:hypothetical protein
LGARADVRQWRVIQSRVDGSLRVELEAAAGAATEVQSAIAQAIRQSVKVSVACLDRIPLAAGEKFRAVLRR